MRQIKNSTTGSYQYEGKKTKLMSQKLIVGQWLTHDGEDRKGKGLAKINEWVVSYSEKQEVLVYHQLI